MITLSGRSHSVFSSYLTWDTSDVPLRVIGFKHYECLKIQKAFRCLEVIDGSFSCDMLFLTRFIDQAAEVLNAEVAIGDLTIRDSRLQAAEPIVNIFDSKFKLRSASVMVNSDCTLIKAEDSVVSLFEKGVRVSKKCPAFLLVDGHNLVDSTFGSRLYPLCKEQTGLGTLRLTHDATDGTFCEVFVKEPLPLLDVSDSVKVTIIS